MSLLSPPFVGSSIDTVLHVIAGISLIGGVGTVGWGFWRVHELPVHHAKKKESRQIALISILTWIGFLMHWVWVLAVIVAFVDFDKLVLHFRQLWLEGDTKSQANDLKLIEQGTIQQKRTGKE
ncbi:MFS transporter [Vibrio sp.]|nr:MFS transporter [Vibrio sp.]